MDTITHGIAGALIAKAFFGEGGVRSSIVGARRGGLAAPGAGHAPPPRESNSTQAASGLAVWATTLGAMFPDSDSLLDVIDPTGMAVITEHRGVTHSLLLLPLWAAVLALVTRRVALRRGRAPGSLSRLVLFYTVGLGSHILLDLVNSWGTMIWSPLGNTRVAWDLVFVIDFTLSAIALLPLAAAWAYQRREGSFTRSLAAWVSFSLGAVGVEWLARVTGFSFSPWVVVAASLIFAAVFFLPGRGAGWGFGVPGATWCRAGVAALVVYVGLCAAAHRVALGRVEQFAAQREVPAERQAAIPLPPSLLHWSGLVRTASGVYAARFSLLDGSEPEFEFVADDAANGFIAAARQAPLAQTYLWFARFPVARYIPPDAAGGRHVVEFTDLRFFARGTRRNNAFTFRVVLDDSGRIVEQGWAED